MENEVIIYKATERKVLAQDGLQYCLFDQVNQSFLNLVFFDDIYLSPLQKLELNKYPNCQLLILPIIGGVEIDDASNFVGAEQFYWKPTHHSTQLFNPYEEAEVNCFVIGFQLEVLTSSTPLFGEINLSKPNCFFTFLDLPNAKASVGIFGGREEAVYQTKNFHAGVFCMVISGIFEVNGRLLHPRDGLSFSSELSLDVEALSDNAVILFIETTQLLG